jgi:hypothetical protein
VSISSRQFHSFIVSTSSCQLHRVNFIVSTSSCQLHRVNFIVSTSSCHCVCVCQCGFVWGS